MIGETVGNFEIISQLGKGGWGAVYLAQQKSIKTKVAIKVLESDVSTNTKHVERFFNEAVAVSKIHHSGIVKIFDVGVHTNGQAYLVMEYLEGETLTARIAARKRLPLGMVADFGRQIASVLDATHGAGITHRDLKPDNIYLVHDAELINRERVKVLDFGIAKLQQPAGARRVTSLDAAMIGTPSYMSPEQWHSLAEADWRTDAYALGCVAFEMVCGRPPFVGESSTDVCAQHLTEPPPVPSALVPGLPAKLDRLIARLLEKEPDGRPTMREAMDVFTELGHGEGVALRSLPPTMASPLLERAEKASQAMTVRGGPVTEPVLAAAAVPAKKSSRRALVASIGAIALTGVAAAAVVVSTTKDNPTTAVDVATSRVDATLANTPPVVDVAAAIDAAVAVVPPDAATDVVDAAVAAELPPEVDAGVAALDAGVKVAAPPKPPVRRPTTAGPASIPTGVLATGFATRRRAMEICGIRYGVSGGFKLRLDVTPDARIRASWAGPPPVEHAKELLGCMTAAAAKAVFSPSAKGGSYVMTLILTGRPANGGRWDPQNDPREPDY